MNRPGRWIVAAFLILSTVTVWGKDPAPATLGVAEPTWNLVSGSEVPTLKRLWTGVLAQVAEDLAPLNLGKATGKGPQIRVTLSGESGAYSLVLQLEGVAWASDTMKYLSITKVDPSLVLSISRAIEALARPLLGTAKVDAPVLVDSFSPSDLLGVDLPQSSSLLSPWGLALRGNDRLLVAAGSAVLEFDDRWNVIALPAHALSDDGQMNFAFGLAVTPAGTLFVKSVDGSGLWSIAEGSDEVRRVRFDVPAGGGFGVLSDGSPFAVSLNPKSLRVLSSGTVRELPLAADSMVMAAASGPDNTLWLADLVHANLQVVSADGRVLDFLYPEIPQGTSLVKLKLLDDGSFLGVTNQDVRRFDKRGNLLWIWDGKSEGLALTFSLYSDVAVDSRGLIYLNDYLGKRIFRLSENPKTLSPPVARVAAASKAVRADARNAEALLALANAYKDWGAPEAEMTILERYLELRPADAKALDRRLTVQSGLLGAKAAAGEASVASLLKRFGPETARDGFERTMKTLETLRSVSPQDPRVLGRIVALRRLMSAAENSTATAAPVPEVKTIQLAALFPSLIQSYRSKAAGTVNLKNTLKEPLRDVRVDLFVPKYMDFPSQGAVIEQVAADGEVSLGISAFLNERVLEIEEDLPVQAQLTIRFTDATGPRSFDLLRPLTLYRRTALTWDDTGKLASFITPNEESISRTAFQMLQAQPGGTPLVSSSFQRAAQICDSLGAFPLRYVPDPQSSFSLVSEDGGQVDTVRFPRTTLSFQGGDCDDTTALLASLLESTGLKTAILTTPGHVFLAFDTGEKPESAWVFEAPGFVTLVRSGSLWIPLESTVLSQGFAEAWSSASSLVIKHQGGKDFEFLPLAGLRGLYPALPLPASSLPLPRPDSKSVQDLHQGSVATLQVRLYTPLVTSLEASRRSLTGKAWSKVSNRMAQVQARFGYPDAAMATLKAIVAKDPTYVSAYLNLSSLSQEAGRKDEAAQWLKIAETAVPGSPSVAGYRSQANLATAPSTGADRAGLTPAPAWSEE